MKEFILSMSTIIRTCGSVMQILKKDGKFVNTRTMKECIQSIMLLIITQPTKTINVNKIFSSYYRL
ncbi:TPA: hypothetical protein RTH08_000914 [Campylobacter jejuni]|nr:hypothetical protein [Campylobacter jejuni]HDZ5097146.1 hypothetical protein [Campylobacter jejuni]